MRRTLAIAALSALVLVSTRVWAAADDWIEVKSAHFTVVSNAGDRTTRRLVWQLEQVRSATSTLFAWAKADLVKPLRVIVVKDENSMRVWAPQYWEDRRAVRPASVWASGPDQHYMVIRSDVEVEQQGTINPYITAYASYIDLVLGQSAARDLPFWLRRGFTTVLSNTIVRDEDILIGAPIPWELQILRERQMLLLPKLLSVTRDSPEYTEATRREVYDAETWAFVHFLMFGEEGARADKLSAFAAMVSSGKEPAVAFAETLGTVESLVGPFRLYYQRPIFSFRRIKIDVSVERERFPVRPLTASGGRQPARDVSRRYGQARRGQSRCRRGEESQPELRRLLCRRGHAGRQRGQGRGSEGGVCQGVRARFDERLCLLSLCVAAVAAEYAARRARRGREAAGQGHPVEHQVRRRLRVAGSGESHARHGRRDWPHPPRDHAGALRPVPSHPGGPGAVAPGQTGRGADGSASRTGARNRRSNEARGTVAPRHRGRYGWRRRHLRPHRPRLHFRHGCRRPQPHRPTPRSLRAP